MATTETVPNNPSEAEQCYKVTVEFNREVENTEFFDRLADAPLVDRWAHDRGVHLVTVFTVGSNRQDGSDRAVAFVRHLLTAAGAEYDGIITTEEIERL